MRVYLPFQFNLVTEQTTALEAKALTQ